MGCLKARAAALAAPAARAYARLAARYAVADEVVEAWTRRLLVANTALGCVSAAVRLLLGGAGCVTYNVVLAIALTACAVDLGLAAVYLGFRRRWCCVSLHEDGVIAFIFTIIPGMSLAVGAWCCGEHRTLTASLLSAKVLAQACYLGAFARVQVLRRRRDLALAQQERWDEATKTLITDGDVEAGERCCVCQDEFEKCDDCVALPCAHVLHGACASQWWITNLSCPLCKGPVYHPDDEPPAAKAPASPAAVAPDDNPPAAPDVRRWAARLLLPKIRTSPTSCSPRASRDDAPGAPSPAVRKSNLQTDFNLTG
ncbi:hypothetical protein JL721_9157 [Aureococcus anophagefferens]|nr:hypothetical protein JL721_9157 [Aureococcus anophagefferens]